MCGHCGGQRHLCFRAAEAPLTHEIAVEAQLLAMPHRDLADRFLAATAKVLDLTLVTADTNLLELGEMLGNR
ncbi:MAG: PIN domain-containing protein [Candidatus Sulfotelmatobacter sp.]